LLAWQSQTYGIYLSNIGATLYFLCQEYEDFVDLEILLNLKEYRTSQKFALWSLVRECCEMAEWIELVFGIGAKLGQDCTVL